MFCLLEYWGVLAASGDKFWATFNLEWCSLPAWKLFTQAKCQCHSVASIVLVQWTGSWGSTHPIWIYLTWAGMALSFVLKQQQDIPMQKPLLWAYQTSVNEEAAWIVDASNPCLYGPWSPMPIISSGLYLPPVNLRMVGHETRWGEALPTRGGATVCPSPL